MADSSVTGRFAASYNKSWVAYDARVEAGTQPNLPGVNYTSLLYANMVYLCVTVTLYRLMSARKEAGKKRFELKWVIFFYNVSCILAAGYCAVHIILYKIRKPGTFACNEIGRTDAEAQHLAFVFWVFYAQKFWEFLDTWFFILRHSFRQVTFLHLFHHSSITIVVGSILRFDYCGDMFLPILLNSIVHVLMYGHYALTVLGIKSWWRAYLTTLQLMQFILISTQAITAYNTGAACGAPDFAKIIMVVYMGSMLILFGRFFLLRYVIKKEDTTMCGVIKHVAPPVRVSYSGMATLDKKGEAAVHMPPHYDAARAARASFVLSYQLAPVGAPMPQLHVAEEMALKDDYHVFRIAGGAASKRVSWTVTAEQAIAETPYTPRSKAE